MCPVVILADTNIKCQFHCPKIHPNGYDCSCYPLPLLAFFQARPIGLSLAEGLDFFHIYSGSLLPHIVSVVWNGPFLFFACLACLFALFKFLLILTTFFFALFLVFYSIVSQFGVNTGSNYLLFVPIPLLFYTLLSIGMVLQSNHK